MIQTYGIKGALWNFKFYYLGATINKDGCGTRDMENRLSEARGTFVRLDWERSGAQSKSCAKQSSKLFKTLVIPILLYMGARPGKQSRMTTKQSTSSKANASGERMSSGMTM